LFWKIICIIKEKIYDYFDGILKLIIEKPDSIEWIIVFQNFTIVLFFDRIDAVGEEYTSCLS